jgi:hypothetical protein
MPLPLIVFGGLVGALALAAAVTWPRARKLDGVQKYSDAAEDETDGGNTMVDPVEVGIVTTLDDIGGH